MQNIIGPMTNESYEKIQPSIKVNVEIPINQKQEEFNNKS